MSSPGSIIELHEVTARVAPLALAPITASIGAGITALVGTRDDGVALLLAVLAGREPAKKGKLTVLGADVSRSDPATRAAIGYVPLDAVLPESLRVNEVLELAARVRGEPVRDALARLDVLGIASLAQRRVRSLSPEEVRAVAAAEAISSAKTTVLLFEEPFAVMDPRASAAIGVELQRRAREGACVVFTTASTRESHELASHDIVFSAGVVRRQGKPLDPVAIEGARGAAIRVVVSNTKALLAALGEERDVTRVEADPNSVLIRGASAVDLARAIARAVKRADVELESMRIEPLPLAPLRAAISGDLAAEYKAAFDRAQNRGQPRPEVTT
jgi:ABC-type multidrug transport system ATPase subunit